jgi:three-Cys-motif partner protein
VQTSDANQAVHGFCAGTDWSKTRAIMFLDPFGNQVNWETIQVIASTRAIDLWYLFPAHLGVNRQIAASGIMEDTKAASLDRVLGTSEWRDEFLERKESVDLFELIGCSVGRWTSAPARYIASRPGAGNLRGETE